MSLDVEPAAVRKKSRTEVEVNFSNVLTEAAFEDEIAVEDGILSDASIDGSDSSEDDEAEDFTLPEVWDDVIVEDLDVGENRATNLHCS